jgi:hypothetical protein
MGTFVQYVAYPGIVRRGVTKEDFKGMGIDHPDVWFDNTNRNQVDASEMPEEVLEVFRQDPDFKVVEKDEEPRAPKSFTGEGYDRDLAEATTGDAPGGEGSVSGTGGTTAAVTTATSRAGGTTGGTRGTTR